MQSTSRLVRSVCLQVGVVRGWLLTERRDSPKIAQPNMMADLLSEATFKLNMKTN
jgi:hypothetical protein